MTKAKKKRELKERSSISKANKLYKGNKNKNRNKIKIKIIQKLNQTFFLKKKNQTNPKKNIKKKGKAQTKHLNCYMGEKRKRNRKQGKDK